MRPDEPPRPAEITFGDAGKGWSGKSRRLDEGARVERACDRFETVLRAAGIMALARVRVRRSPYQGKGPESLVTSDS
jgi:hypothetical protein